MKIKIDEDTFISVVNSSNSMAEAASKLGIHFNTFKRYAIKFNVYKPNQGLKGGTKMCDVKIPTEVILRGDYPQFNTYKLKIRLIKDGVLKNECSECGISEWNGKPLNCELDHIDGNRTNHKIENLRILCPNCHSQTETYRSKNKKDE